MDIMKFTENCSAPTIQVHSIKNSGKEATAVMTNNWLATQSDNTRIVGISYVIPKEGSFFSDSVLIAYEAVVSAQSSTQGWNAKESRVAILTGNDKKSIAEAINDWLAEQPEDTMVVGMRYAIPTRGSNFSDSVLIIFIPSKPSSPSSKDAFSSRSDEGYLAKNLRVAILTGSETKTIADAINHWLVAQPKSTLLVGIDNAVPAEDSFYSECALITVCVPES